MTNQKLNIENCIEYKLIIINEGVETEIKQHFEEEIEAEFYAEGLEPEAYKIVPINE